MYAYMYLFVHAGKSMKKGLGKKAHQTFVRLVPMKWPLGRRMINFFIIYLGTIL